MTKKKNSHVVWILLVLLVCVSISVSAADLTIEYLDGYLDIKTSSGWEELYTGDSIPDTAVLRLDADSVAELSGPSSDVTLTKEGIYEIRKLLSASSSMASVGLGNLIAGKLGSIVKDNNLEPSAVGGVRAAEVDTGDDLEWISSETAELIETGKNLLAQNKADEALGIFEEALDFADFDEEPEVYFYLGYTYTVLGSPSSALENLNEVNQDPSYDFYDDLVLLRGQLLIETFDYEEAVSWLEEYQKKNSGSIGSTETIQTAYLLSSFAYSGLGNTTKAKGALNQVISIDSSSDTAEAARKLLGNM